MMRLNDVPFEACDDGVLINGARYYTFCEITFLNLAISCLLLAGGSYLIQVSSFWGASYFWACPTYGVWRRRMASGRFIAR
jgi:hypothetical protein